MPPRWPSAAQRLGRTNASFGQRLGAFLLDGVLLSLVLAVPAVLGVVLLVTGYDDRPGTCTDDNGRRYLCDVPTTGWVVQLVLTIGAYLVLSLALVLLYHARTEGRTGQTWGKRVVGIRTVDATTGQPIGAWRAVGRVLGRYVSSQIVYLGFLWMLWDDDAQTWHDKMVRSIVVQG